MQLDEALPVLVDVIRDDPLFTTFRGDLYGNLFTILSIFTLKIATIWRFLSFYLSTMLQ